MAPCSNCHGPGCAACDWDGTAAAQGDVSKRVAFSLQMAGIPDPQLSEVFILHVLDFVKQFRSADARYIRDLALTICERGGLVVD